MSHDNIIKLHKVIEHPDKKKLNLVFDYHQDGSVEDEI